MRRKTSFLLCAGALAAFAAWPAGAAAQSLEGAFAFGSRNLTCETPNQPGTNYTMVHHAANNQAAHDALAYDAALGYGFVVIDPGNAGRNGSEQFGPFDDSPNNRNNFGDACPEEIYDSFIGFKNHLCLCDQTVAGNTTDPCDATDLSECGGGMAMDPYQVSGGIFRVDVPNGIYRFVGAFGEADNHHATRVLAEDGGSGGPDMIGPNHVVLVNNHDQAQFDIGQARGDRLGAGVFAAVGFGSKAPPAGDGVAPDPVFVNMDRNGLPTSGPADSPFLRVTQGYVRLHLLQANSNDGPGGARDPNGADIVLLEVWKVAEDTKGFAFGSRDLTCPTATLPGENYTMIHHAGNNQAAHDALAYDAALGYGFESLYTADDNFGGFGDRNGSGQFGPFDDSPNNRNAFGDTCPDELYDSFIGAKNYTNECSATTIGDPDTPCSPTIPAEGLIFRVDCPNGFYRFAAAVGEASNRHAHRLLAEDGGSGTPAVIGPNHVVLVANHDQAEAGPGNFARVGFDGVQPPEGDGIAPDPVFTNMDENGLASGCPPNSPVLEVTQGYVRFHMLQGNSNDGAAGARDPNGTDIVVLELWQVPTADVSPSGFFVDVTREVQQVAYTPNGRVDVSLTVSGVVSPTTIVETIPAGFSILDPGDGVPDTTTISFEVAADGTVGYSLMAGDACDLVTFSGTVSPSAGGCEGEIGGQTELGCIDFRCTAAPEATPPTLEGAFLFGSRNLTCPTHNEPSVNYTMVHHVNDPAGYDAIAYDAAVGHGFETLYDPDTAVHGSRNTSGRFGPFDDSPNNRNRFGSTCPDEMYDSFIGLKDFQVTCDQTGVGSVGCAACEHGISFPDDTTYEAEGAVFRVDVPNGFYRFVGAFGEADNPHASRVLAEDGGGGLPGRVGANHVVLVENHDQAQFDIGEADPAEPGKGVFARVGFNCRVPPLGDGVAPDPQFVDYGEDGCPVLEGENADSPTLEVTQGYIRFHLLQANSNDGPGGPRDPNGTDIVALEVWKLAVFDEQIAGDCDQSGDRSITDVICYVRLLFPGFLLVSPGAGFGPCATGEGNTATLDVNGDAMLNVSDIVRLARFLFSSGEPPVQGEGCFPIDTSFNCNNAACDGGA